MDHRSSVASVLQAPRHTAVAAAAALAACIIGAAAVGVAAGLTGEPTREIESMVSEYIASWNTHDAAVLAEYFTADADMIMGNGPMLEGRTAIQDWWRDYFAVQEPERRLTIEIRSARAITTDVVVVDVLTTTGGRAPQGVDLPARRARGTWVVVRLDGHWLIAALRGMPTEKDRIIRSGGGADH